MEALYSKLYDKFIKLKTKKLSELDQLNKEQEVKFMNYVTAAEELVEHLKSQNEQLDGQVNELRCEVASVRLAKDKQVAEYQRLLMEESKKNEALSEEVEKLRKLQQEGTSGDLNNNSKVMAEDDQFRAISNSSSRRMTRKRMQQEGTSGDLNDNNEALSEEVEKLRKLQQEGTSGDLNNNSKVMAEDDQFRAISNSSSRRMTRKRMQQEGTSGDLNDNSKVIVEDDQFGAISNGSSRRMTRKCSKQDVLGKEARFISCKNSEGSFVVRESTQNFCKETASGKLLECCTKANDQSGVGLQESGHSNWLIQALFEYALGMTLSIDYQTGQICLSALHQSSGYSFSLTWISKAPGEEAELLYHVLSLGTFERVAPEWMREDIMFSPTMCSIFFERVSHVIKLNH